MTSITYIADAPIPSRAANCVQVLQMSSALAKAGCDVALLAPWQSDRLRGEPGRRRQREDFGVEHPLPIHYIPYPHHGARFGGSYFPLAVLTARLSRRRIVMTRNARIAAMAATAGLQVVLETHMPPNSAAQRSAWSRLQRSSRLAVSVFISEQLRTLCKDLLLASTPSVVLHDAVDQARFEPRQSREAARSSLGISPSGPVVAHAGSLYAGRGAEELISLLPTLPEGAELWFVGGRPEDVKRLEGRVPASSRNRVRFFGHRRVSELPTFLYAADALVIASTSAGTAIDGTCHVDYSSPMKLFEYLAAGRPIVATALSGVREIISHGDNGYLVEPDSPDGLAAGLNAVLRDADLARRLELGAARTAAEHTWERRARDILQWVR